MKGTLTQVNSGVIFLYPNDEVSTRKAIPSVYFIGRNIHKQRRIFSVYFQGKALYKILASISINLWLTKTLKLRIFLWS